MSSKLIQLKKTIKNLIIKKTSIQLNPIQFFLNY